MIKFFRKIRQKLISVNKFSKYILYAIGEIILVVIGILIALSINNRNEYNKSCTNTTKDLNQIKYELGQDINAYKNDISYGNWFVKYFNHVKLKEFDSINVKNIFKVISSNLRTLDLIKSYNKLNDSGNMDIIKDSILISSLHDYFLEERERYNKNAKFNAGFTSDKIEGYLIYELALDEKMQTTEDAVINEMDNGKLINLINYQSNIYQRNNDLAEKLIQKAENIINLIEKEINN